MPEAVLDHPRSALESFRSTRRRWGAWRAAPAPGNEIGVWRYSFALPANRPVEDIRVRLSVYPDALEPWTGLFACASGRHVEVLPWPEAHAVVVAAANALYIVDPSRPEQFSGIAAPVEIDDVIFDESAEMMFVADSLRVYAFGSDRLLRWASEPLDGYDAHFSGCAGRVLAVAVKESAPGPDGEEVEPSIVRLRTEDGTILRSRFRILRRCRMKPIAA